MRRYLRGLFKYACSSRQRFVRILLILGLIPLYLKLFLHINHLWSDDSTSANAHVIKKSALLDFIGTPIIPTLRHGTSTTNKPDIPDKTGRLNKPDTLVEQGLVSPNQTNPLTKKLKIPLSSPQTPGAHVDSEDHIKVDGKAYYLPKIVDEETFTMVMLTHERTHFLMRTLKHYGTMARIEEIVLLVNGVTDVSKITRNLTAEGLMGKTRILPLSGNDLLQRFMPTPALKTQAVFSIDDDILIASQKLWKGFELWKRNPRSIVGFPYKLHVMDKKTNALKYKWDPFLQYSMVLTGAAFYHKSYQSIVSDTIPEGVASIVNRWMNCEDIAFNMHVAKHCNCSEPAMALRQKQNHSYTHLGRARQPGSLSHRKNHDYARTKCLQEFPKYYNNSMPLRISKKFYSIPMS